MKFIQLTFADSSERWINADAIRWFREADFGAIVDIDGKEERIANSVEYLIQKLARG